MIPVAKDKVTALNKALHECGNWPCSNQGRPLDGWEIILDINGVPAIIREDRQDVLLNRAKHILELNKKDHTSASFTAHICLTLVMQCATQHRKLDLTLLLDSFDFEGKNAAEKWVLVGDTTIGQVLTTQEFHKPVLERMWRVWMWGVLQHCGLLKLQADQGLFDPLFVRGVKSKYQMVESFEEARNLALNNTLSQATLE